VLQRELTDSCIFVEHLADNNYNTYASQKHSTPQRSLFLALDRRGQPRRARWRPPQPLGRLAKYVQVLTKSVDPHRVEELGRRLRHHNHHALCPPAAVTATAPPSGPSHERCRRGRRPAHGRHRSAPAAPRRHCDPSEDEDVCHKRLQMIAVKKRKSRNENRGHRRRKQHGHGRPRKTAPPPPEPSAAPLAPAPPAPAAVHAPATTRNNQRNNPMQLQVLSPEADEDEDDVEEDLEDEDGDEMTTATSASPMPSPAPDA